MNALSCRDSKREKIGGLRFHSYTPSPIPACRIKREEHERLQWQKEIRGANEEGAGGNNKLGDAFRTQVKSKI